MWLDVEGSDHNPLLRRAGCPGRPRPAELIRQKEAASCILVTVCSGYGDGVPSPSRGQISPQAIARSHPESPWRRRGRSENGTGKALFFYSVSGHVLHMSYRPIK